MLDGLVEDAVKKINEPARHLAPLGMGLPRTDQGELVERTEDVTFVLQAPGYWDEDLSTGVIEGKLEVRSADFVVRRQLPTDVDISEIDKRYTNGVLTVRIKKLQ